MSDLTSAVIDWYDVHARDLPWREQRTTPWAVLVSEVMLQQTPVSRVVPTYRAWIDRWPVPAALAAAPVADAIRAWGSLGYPRRALRLHESARAIVDRHGGVVPRDLEALLALPGVGAYTARAVATFAYGGRHAVVDTNVRRVVARAVAGVADGGAPSPRRDLSAVEPLLPADDADAARFSAALMELGALVCTARPRPRCEECPVRDRCRWRLAGYPAATSAARRAQGWRGTDRQARGALLRALRESADGAHDLATTWPDAPQRERALRTLVADGLVERTPDGSVFLAGSAQRA